ncbi:MFS transporter [Streptomyces alanosinicus]|uniref:MFS transporter n=1 Tax=Streptomyces alanosinicus TaxID=68171 RepID=UPI0035709FC6
MVTLDTTAVAIANPAIAREFHGSLAGLEWVTNSYVLMLAIALIPAGPLGDRCGHRVVFLIGLRAVQGLFGALLQPSGLGLLRGVFPGDRPGAAVGARGMAMAASTAAGPVVAGLLVGGQRLGIGVPAQHTDRGRRTRRRRRSGARRDAERWHHPEPAAARPVAPPVDRLPRRDDADGPHLVRDDRCAVLLHALPCGASSASAPSKPACACCHSPSPWSSPRPWPAGR